MASIRPPRAKRSPVLTEVVGVVNSPLGWMAWRYGPAGVIDVTIGAESRGAALMALGADSVSSGQALERSSSSELGNRLARYAAGECVEFDDFPLDDAAVSPFAKRVIAACRKLRWGETTSYKALAQAAGSPAAARAVGGVMAGNRWPIVVPCHRVISAAGALQGFSAPSGVALKRRMLELETRPMLRLFR